MALLIRQYVPPDCTANQLSNTSTEF